MKGYRICERKNGKILTLFHGFHGSRILPEGVWLDAIIKTVWDGSRKTAKQYTSGFHVLPTMQDCRNFVKKFRAPRDLIMVECEVEGIRRKEHSTSNVYLADRMKIIGIVEKLEIKKKI